MGGLLLGTAVFFALALGTGSTQTSLLILGPLATFARPAVAMVAFWWNDWPGSRLTTPWTGLIDTLLVAAASVVLTIAGQAVVERADLRGVFEASPGPGVPTTFPATMALAGVAFTAMLQLSLVCERWPLGGIGRLRSGIGALALSWAIGTGAYFLFVNLDAMPAAERAAAGLRNPGGPIAGPDFGSALIAVGVWQAVFFIGLVALALDRALAAYAGSVRWTRATPDEWLTTAALSFIGAGIILHVGIGLRWPFAHKTTQENP